MSCCSVLINGQRLSYSTIQYKFFNVDSVSCFINLVDLGLSLWHSFLLDMAAVIVIIYKHFGHQRILRSIKHIHQYLFCA